MRIAVVGKGGAGKSVIAGTAARLLGRRGLPVLALDSDLMPGLAVSLGARRPPEPLLNDAATRGEDGRWRLRKGIGPVRAVERYSIAAPDGVRLLEAGKLTPDGLAPMMGSVQAFYKVIHRLPKTTAFDGWAIVGDLPAGPRQAAFDWAPYARAFVVLAEPTWKSALTARRVARIARSRRAASVLPVANKVGGEDDVSFVEEVLGERTAASIPADPAVASADREGAALVDHAADSPALAAIRRLVELLERGSLDPVVLR